MMKRIAILFALAAALIGARAGLLQQFPPHPFLQAGAAEGDTYWTDTVSRVCHLNFETTNTTASLDVSGNNRHATNYPSVGAGPTWTICGTNSLARVEHCYSFDGSDDTFWLADNSFNEHYGSFACWLYPVDTVAAYAGYMVPIFSQYNDENNFLNIYLYGTTETSLQFSVQYVLSGVYQINQNAGVCSTGQWCHLAWAYTNSDSRVYQDAVLLDTVSTSVLTGSIGWEAAWLGYYYRTATGAKYARQNMDDARFYQAILTSTQITNVFRNTNPTNNLEAR